METPTEIIVLCAKSTSRMEYVARFFSTVTGVTFTIILAQEYNDKSVVPGGYLIHYNNKPVDGEYTIFAAGLMEESGIKPHVPAVIKENNQTFLFPAPNGFDLPFDLFSAAFFLLTRYEEYLPYAHDQYGRFEAKQSLAFQQSFLEEPVIDQWLSILKPALELKFPALRFPQQAFRFVSTIDVDNPWAYLHKGIIHTTGRFIKNALLLNFRELYMITDVLRKKTPDPYDTYDYIRQVEQKYNFRSVFFFLCGNYGRYDTNYALETGQFRKLLDSMKSERAIGIHPSYKSNQSENLLKSEFERFARFSGKKPEISRQHFLKLHLPDTYRNLISLNVEKDYSMGYASCVGFRAGTCLPFSFYDLIKEKETSLLVHPFVIMDVTLRQYLNLKPEEAAERIGTLIEKTKAVNGIFTSIWHNESLSEQGTWKGWRRVFEGMVREGTRNK